MKNLLLWLILISAMDATAQTQSEYDRVIFKIKVLIKEHYIVSDKIQVLSDSIGGLNYSHLSAKDFVEKINLELLLYSNDKHLSLEYNPDYVKKMKSDSDANEGQRKNEVMTNFGFKKVEILEGNIGLLRLSYFADPDGLDDLIKGTFAFLKNTDALIIDLRGNSGGSGGMLQKMMSGFLPDKSAAVLRIAYKHNTVQLSTDSDPSFSYHKPLYLLCDQKTFSAGEGFAFILQNRKRAMVLGETTAGAGNIAGPHVVDDNFVITIPVGVIVDVLTGKGWEGSGVIPDIQIASEMALEKAIETAKKKK